jgi:hypothetical protein
MDIRAIAASCESLGRNCEFGLVQRKFDLEPVSLLRWAGAEKPDGLIDALTHEFAGLGEEMDGKVTEPDGPVNARYWWLTCRRYGILFHTLEKPSLLDLPLATEKVRPRLRRLAERLMEEIKDGRKLFVFSSADFADPLDGLPLIDAFRTAGGRGALLIVAQGEEDEIDQIDFNTFGAKLPRLTPWHGANAIDYEGWLRLLPKIQATILES